MIWRLIIILCLLPCVLLAQEKYMGVPFVTKFTVKDYKAGSQVWMVSQDAQGLYYTVSGNLAVFNGVEWEEHVMDNVPRNWFHSSTGRMYFGGDVNLGYAEYGETGELEFTYLNDLLPKSEYDKYWIIRDIFEQPDGQIVFTHRGRVFRYDGDTIRVFPNNEFVYSGFLHEGKSMISTGKGMYEIESDSLVRYDYKSEGMDSVPMAFGCHFGDTAVFITTRGAYKLHDDSLTRMHFNIDKLLTGAGFTSVQPFKDGLVVGTAKQGVVVFDRDLNPLMHVTEQTGLQANDVYHIFVDHYDNIWVSHSNGMSVIHMRSGITTLDARVGLPKTLVLGVLPLYNDKVYAQTNYGIYERAWRSEIGPFDDAKNFTQRKDLVGQTWGWVEARGKLLVGNNVRTYQMSGDEVTLVGQEGPWDMMTLDGDSNHVIQGLYNGFEVLEFEDGNWKHSHLVKGFNENSRYFEQDKDGLIWLCDQRTIYKLKFARDLKSVVTVDSYSPQNSNLIDSGNYVVKAIDGELRFLAGSRLLKFDEDGNDFERCSEWDQWLGDSIVIDVTAGPKGNLWYETRNRSGVLIKEENGYKNVHRPFYVLDRGRSVMWDPIDDNNILMPFESGVFHLNLSAIDTTQRKYATLLSEVDIGHEYDSAVFFGGVTYENTDEIAYRLNFMRFRYAAPYVEEYKKMRYSYKLEGLDEDWSKWSTKSEKEYTNLSEGSYVFQVKAKNVYEEESSMATYSFSIAPPWYRTLWAYLVYFVLFIVLLVIITRINARRLKEEKRQLEQLVDERTIEVKKKNEALRGVNSELRDMNENIRQQRDQIAEKNAEILKANKKIQDSITYGKSIQEAMLTSDQYLANIFSEQFVVYQPRDMVSGDFYWAWKSDDNKIFWAVADCTGHGVPGAFMSMIGNSLLNEVIIENGVVEVHEILDALRSGMIRAMTKDGETKTDGMDICLCCYDLNKNELDFAGANCPLFIIRNGQLIEHDGDQMAIGYDPLVTHEPFTKLSVPTEPGDLIYLSTDGVVDQKGGDLGKKYYPRRLRALLQSVSALPISKQKSAIEEEIRIWKGDRRQIDDIALMGVQLPNSAKD